MNDDKGFDGDQLHFEEAAPRGSSLANMIGTKNLLIVIVTMPFVFLVVVMAIIAIFGRPGGGRDDVAGGAVFSTPVAQLDDAPASVSGDSQRVVLAIPAAVDAAPGAIALPAGAKPGAMALDGDRLALRVEGADGDMIVVYDLAANAVVQTIQLVTESE